MQAQFDGTKTIDRHGGHISPRIVGRILFAPSFASYYGGVFVRSAGTLVRLLGDAAGKAVGQRRFRRFIVGCGAGRIGQMPSPIKAAFLGRIALAIRVRVGPPCRQAWERNRLFCSFPAFRF